MKNYNNYYYNYLGYNYKKNNIIVPNKVLENPINKKYNYLAIITNINGKEIISINKNYYKNFLKLYNIKIYKNNLEIIKEFFKLINIKINIKYMYRMTTTKKNKSDDKDIIFKEDKMKCAILNNNKIISYAKISNIDYNGANIVIFTEEKYRKNGYATKLLSYITNYCLENNLTPIFLVDKNNKVSIKTALKNNYKIINKEIIISFES